MSETSTPAPVKEEEIMQNRPESPPLGLLDPSRIQNPLADQPAQQIQQGHAQMPENFVIPEPRPQPWQRSTPVMSPANTGYPMGGAPGTPGSQRSSTNTPGGQQQPPPQYIHHENSPQQQQYEQYQQYQQQQYHLQQQQQQQQQQQVYPGHYPPQQGYPGGYPGGPPGARPWPPAGHPQARPIPSPAAQRVVVPYPQGQMTPGGGAPPQPPPGYPVTSPVTRTPPRPGPVGYPPPPQQQQPQQQPPPQQQTPQYPPQHTPTGGPYSSPAPQMYRPGGAVVAQVAPMQQRPGALVPQQQPQQPPQYMSPQTPVTPHNHFPPSVQQQQQQQMTPSPHFGPGGPDLRSPNHLMSPSQPGPPPPNMRPMPLPVPVPSNYQYRTHDIRQLPINANPELFLTGCVFHIFEVDKLISDKLDLMNLVFAIKFFGGDLDFGPKPYPEKSLVVTHVIIDSNRSQFARMPIDQRKRLVTSQWLIDILQKQKMEVPWKLAHLPGPFTDAFRPYHGKLFSVAGFDETERPAIQFMAEAMGARISPFLAKFNDLLIAKPTMSASAKIEKAREWSITVVTFQWLADNYCTASQAPQDRPSPEMPRYQLGQPTIEVNSTPSMMEIQSQEIRTMLLAWKQHIIVTEDSCRRARENRLRLLNDDAHFPNNRFLNQAPPPTDEQLAEAEKRNAESKEPKMRVIVTFGKGFSETVLDSLTKKLQFLGGRLCDDVKDCTHLVLLNGRRSQKLLEGICLGKNIMSCDWILDGYKNGAFMDTLDYFLRDEEIERQLGYSCKRSVLRARHRQIFEGVQFYVTQSVLPDYETIKTLIELAGGKVQAEKPTANYIAKCIETDEAFLIIACDVDVRSMSYLAECNFPIYNVDLILTSILRQNIELHPVFRLMGIVRQHRHAYSNPPTIVPRPMPIQMPP